MGPFEHYSMVSSIDYQFQQVYIMLLNNVFWFDTAGINDIGKFQSGKDAVKGVTGRYQAGFFPVMIMMFGIPAMRLRCIILRNLVRRNKYMLGS